MRVGLTGGSGCGVSTAARWLEARGVAVLRADEIGHQILQLPQVKRDLVDHFGTGILSAEGDIHRQKLGEIVFADPEACQALNRMVHPPLLEELTAQVRNLEASRGLVVVDAALIYEWGLAGFFHKVIVITAPLELRLERAMQRDGLSREQVLQRMAAQWPIEKKAERADFLIENHGTLDDLHRNLETVWREVVKG